MIFKTSKKTLLYILIFLGVSTNVFPYSTTPLLLTDSLKETWLTREYVNYLEDPTAQLTIEDIIKLGKNTNLFLPSTANDLINDNTQSAYWLRFKIKNQSSRPFRLELFDFDINEISLFYATIQNAQYIEKKAGFNYPFSLREIKHKNVSFYIPPSIDTSYCYIRFYSKKHNVLEPIIRSYDQTINYALSEYLLFGLFYGLLILVILYNLIYFISLKKPYYAYFVLYGIGVLLYISSRNGTGFQYLWYNFPEINDHMGESGLFISTISMFLFTRSFLELKENKIYHIISVSILTRSIIYIIQFFYPHYYLFEIFDIIYLIISLAIVYHLYQSGVKPAQWLIIGYSILVLSFLITILEQSSLIPSSVLSVYFTNLGIALQFVLLSIGIAETVKGVYIEKNKVHKKLIAQLWQNELLKEKVNRELEKKIKERTIELNQANEDLKKKDEENIKINIALDLANSQLKRYINSFAKSTITKEYLSFEEFQKAYPDELSCHRYLKELKDSKGFECIKCGHNKTIKGKEKFDTRCAKCNYNESVTANTIFHRTKIPLQKAFYMMYIITQKKDKITALELAKTLEIQISTSQNFKKKVMERLKNQNKKNTSWENIIIN